MTTTYATPPGPPPKAQRRRRNKPASYGEAEPIVAAQSADAQPPLGFDAHQLVADMWTALGRSVESQFFSAADWQRARWECWHASQVLVSGQPTANAWAAIQHGLSEVLISPAAKRRAGISVRPQAVDADADAAVSMVGRYRQALKSV
jgi:hypothetical protein